MTSDKTIKKNWVEGDAFVVKVNEPESILNEQYIILIKHNYVKNIGNNVDFFRAKITKDKKIPRTKEEIEKLEYIKTNVLPYEVLLVQEPDCETLAEANEKVKEKNYPIDEFGYVTTYEIMLNMRKTKNITELEYIGNFDITPPEDEWVDKQHTRYFTFETSPIDYGYVYDLVRFYEDYNLKKLAIYTEEGSKDFHELYDYFAKSKYNEYEGFDWE